MCNIKRSDNLEAWSHWCQVSRDIKWYLCKDLYCYERYYGKLISTMLVYQFKHVMKKGILYAIHKSVSQPASMDLKQSDTQQFLTTDWDIRGLHLAECHSNHQYTEQYFSFNIYQVSVPYVFCNIDSLQTISINRSLLENAILAQLGCEFGSPLCPDDNLGLVDSCSQNADNTNHSFGIHTDQSL